MALKWSLNNKDTKKLYQQQPEEMSTLRWTNDLLSKFSETWEINNLIIF